MALARKQSQDTSQPKAPITPEQRKMYAGMAIAGALFLLAGGLFLPRMLGGGEAPPTGTAGVTSDSQVAATGATGDGTEAGVVTPGAGGVPGADAGAVAGTVAGVVPGSTVASTVSQPLLRSRRDPFQQLYFIPTPTPVPPTPVPIPTPVVIPVPNESLPVFLPGSASDPARLQQPLNLPPVSIRRLDQASRRPVDAFPPRRSAGSEGGGGAGANPSADKRLSGVIIGDGVRALLEIQGPNGPVTRVVQPGDEVEGITVLTIQRFNDGTRPVTRMVIRENGEERTVDLRAGAPLVPQGGAGGILGN